MDFEIVPTADGQFNVADIPQEAGLIASNNTADKTIKFLGERGKELVRIDKQGDIFLLGQDKKELDATLIVSYLKEWAILML